MESNKILVGDCEDLYDQLEDHSVQLCINSPPYHASRDYECKRTIFDGYKDCDHVWIKDLPQIWKNKFEPVNFDVEKDEKFNTYHFCSKCGAWYGKLGHEPDWNDRIITTTREEQKYQLVLRGYINHLCDKYDKLKTKLTKNGSLVVVIGDKFASKVAGSGGKKSKKIHVKGTENFQAFKPIKLQYKEPLSTQLALPFRFAFEMEKRGWIIKQIMPWVKNNAFPSSIKTKFTPDYEVVIWFVLNAKNYKFNTQRQPMKCPDAKSKNATNKHDGYGSDVYSGFEYDASDYPDGRLKRSSIDLGEDPEAIEYHFDQFAEEIGYEEALQLLDKRFKDFVIQNTERCKHKHFAVYPRELIRPYILAMTDENDIVLDNFMGAGTTAVVCIEENRKYIGFEISEEYKKIADERIVEANKIKEHRLVKLKPAPKNPKQEDVDFNYKPLDKTFKKN